jgi:hypothetical protein
MRYFFGYRCGGGHSQIQSGNQTLRTKETENKKTKTMKIQIDLKSALCGLIIGVAAMFAIGAGTSSNPIGKYEIRTGVGNNGGYAIMIDTQTGQAWGQLAGIENDWGSSSSAKFWEAE